MEIIKIILAIILPPLGVFLQVGIGKHFWINIILTILGYIPGIVHAIWVIAKNKQIKRWQIIHLKTSVGALAATGRHRFKPKYKMTKYGCKHCGDVCQVYKIVSPSDLKKAIRVVQDNIADGTVIESDFWHQQYLKI